MPIFISVELRKELMKLDLGDIVKEVRSLYAKDKKIQSIVCTGDVVKTEYTEQARYTVQQDCTGSWEARLR
jgi:uncharacterized protein (UPF0218 family)